MYLKSLVLKGFKSFADRSVFAFEPGVTAIVGPNGSGKSNISDAVLWVLGERNAKNLRGQAMEDVIFAGSSARKAVGVAEVELVLDNTDGTLPIEFSEVSLGRRMYRNGESEYLINGSIARRMDVLDILHDSGLGTGTASIISQGHLSSILQGKPEDRRTLIEEAAGVLKHKQRKLKSERKLAQMDVHLTRVQDIVAEVERQVKPLERKAKRAMAYRDVSAQLADLNLDLAVDDLRALQGKWAEVGKREQEFDERIAAMRQNIASTESAAEALQVELQGRSVDAGAVAQRYRRAQASLDKLDSTVLLLHEKKRSSQSYRADLKISLENESQSSKDAEGQLAAAVESLASAQKEAAVAENAKDAAQSKSNDLRDKTRSMQGEIDEASHNRRAALQEIEGVRAAQAQTQEVLARNRAHEKLIVEQTQDLSRRLELAKQADSAAAESLAANKGALGAALKADEVARESAGRALVERDQAREAYEHAQEVWSSSSAEVKSLEEIERARRAENPMLAWISEHTGDFEQRMNPLVDAISAPSDLEDLVDELLGDDVASLIVRDKGAATRAAVRLLSAGESGKVSLVPLDTTSGERLDGINGRLIDSLTYPADAAGAVTALLGNVVVCTDAEEAMALSRQHEGSCCATRDGFIVWPSGKITCVRKSAEGENALARHRSLEAARIRLESAIADREAAARRRDLCEQKLRDAQAESLKASQQKAQLQGQESSVEAEAARASDALGALVREQQGLDVKRDATREALAKAEPDAQALEQKLQQLSDQIDSEKARLDKKREDISPIRHQADEAAAALADAKLAAATCAERVTYAERIVASRKHDIETSAAQMERTERTIARKTALLSRIDPLLDTCAALAESARLCAQKLENATEESQNSSAGLHARINEARAAARAAHDTFDAANQQLADVRVEKSRLEMQVEAAVNTIVQDCDTPLETAMQRPALQQRTQVEEQAFKLRRRIANMGTINPDAAAEYEELKARFDYLQTQMNDMLAARRSLSRIVNVIDRRMKDDFIDTYHQVDQNFSQIFGVLFPGGTGSLSLVDPDNPETTGVEVNAQPNGKRILKMSLMSGGEQSLVAMALLFAVYKTRSTPFYILDEVEAALDDTNMRRLCSYLDSMREDTQFIMITHQRRTMEMADVLYGITMQSDGVTKVMSQRLDKALHYAEE